MAEGQGVCKAIGRIWSRSRGGKTYAGQFKHLGGEILEYGGDINSCLGANAHLVLCVLLEEALDTTARELECNILANESTDKARLRV